MLSNDSDPDGNQLFVIGQSNNIAPYASTQINLDGSFTYTLNTDHPTIRNLGPGSSLDHVISYTISDGGATSNATLTIHIVGVSDPPV